MSTTENSYKLSVELENWLRSKKPKTFASLSSVFAEKSILVIILILMAVPALPIPTGGVTHVFEIITMILAVELIAGARKIWLPKRWQNIRLNRLAEGKAMRKFLSLVRWFERHSSPRLRGLIETGWAKRVAGLLITILAMAAFLAPPFSWLDTLPSLSVVVICLGMMLEDALLAATGVVVGAAGIGLIIGLGAAVFNVFG